MEGFEGRRVPMVGLWIVSRDFLAAMEQWVRQAGIGPWTCIRNVEYAELQ